MGYKNVKKTRQVEKRRPVPGTGGVDAVEVYYVTEEYVESVFVSDTSSNYDSGYSSDPGGGYSGE